MTRVLVARLDAVGDVLLAGPAVRAVAEQAEVTLLCGPRGVAAARLLPGVDDMITFAAPWIEPEPEPVSSAAVDDLVRTLRARGFDAALILTSFHQDPLPLALLLRLAGVARIGAICEDYPGSLLDLRHRVEDGLHEVERALSLTAAFGFPMPLGDVGRLRVRHDLPPAPVALPPEYIVVHPGASVPARAWSPAQHAALVGSLAAGGWPVVVTGGRSERSLTAAVAGHCVRATPAGHGVRATPAGHGVRATQAGHGVRATQAGAHAVVDLGGRTDLAGLAGVLRGASVVVAANTGPAHLAAAVGTPVVSLFAPTVPVERWRPWGVPHVVLGALDIDCGGCRARVCPVPGHPCLESVEPDEVIAAVAALAHTRVVTGAAP